MRSISHTHEGGRYSFRGWCQGRVQSISTIIKASFVQVVEKSPCYGMAMRDSTLKHLIGNNMIFCDTVTVEIDESWSKFRLCVSRCGKCSIEFYRFFDCTAGIGLCYKDRQVSALNLAHVQQHGLPAAEHNQALQYHEGRHSLLVSPRQIV